MPNPLCYHVRVLGPPDPNPTHDYYLKAEPNDPLGTVRVRKIPRGQLPPSENHEFQWLPIVFMTEAGKGNDSNRGFVLENRHTGTIISSNGAAKPAALLHSNKIKEMKTAFHFIDGEQGSFKILQIPEDKLVLDVSGSDWEKGLVILYQAHPAVGRNQYWEFKKVE